jgi:hypothetical protein
VARTAGRVHLRPYLGPDGEWTRRESLPAREVSFCDQFDSRSGGPETLLHVPCGNPRAEGRCSARVGGEFVAYACQVSANQRMSLMMLSRMIETGLPPMTTRAARCSLGHDVRLGP